MKIFNINYIKFLNNCFYQSRFENKIFVFPSQEINGFTQ